ncbi:ABC transporter permease subunit [Psychromonas sp. 14N.309.X.WAT.B.A12]|uniref:ABC transporter permease n=1 Tax=Psychromonas sp. 14N.309.X.WAT.B.A12 TaxID=2998322 RepID=UPI0025B0506B|nr:ABC transporter permease subunit [Psychromonas sp. 14N.309.X.WAT.B.A12]MDN2662319.1 ABC transporter permease subunit [Psychromonas sp. 14N.309.X.WAT.B.A12]
MNEAMQLLGFGEGGWGPALLSGTWVTLQISIGAFIVGILIGLLTALAKLYGNPFCQSFARGYTTICRAVPELLLILLFFYGGSSLLNMLLDYLGYGYVEIAGLPVAIIVLGLVQGAYASEIFRGSILAVHSGQAEAGSAYGMNQRKVFFRITLPIMAPHALAGLSNLWVNLIKDSALISVIGTNELLYTAKQAGGSTREYLLFFVSVAVIYYLITLISSYLLRKLEIHLRRWQPKH